MPGLLELNCNTLVKLRLLQKRPLLRNPQSFVDCSMERSIRYNFFIDLESIQHTLSPDYSLNMYFSRRFPHIDSPSFSPYKSLQNVDFANVGNMQLFFQELYSHIDKNMGERV